MSFTSLSHSAGVGDAAHKDEVISQKRRSSKGRSAALFQILSQKINKIKSPEVQLHSARDHNVEKMMKLANRRKSRKSLPENDVPQHGNMVVLDDFDKPTNTNVQSNVDQQFKTVTTSMSSLKISGDDHQPLDFEKFGFYSLDENKELMSLDLELLVDTESKTDRCAGPNPFMSNNFSSSSSSSNSTSSFNKMVVIPELSGLSSTSTSSQHLAPLIVKPGKGKGRKLSDVQDGDGGKSNKPKFGSKESAFTSVPSRNKRMKK